MKETSGGLPLSKTRSRVLLRLRDLTAEEIFLLQLGTQELIDARDGTADMKVNILRFSLEKIGEEEGVTDEESFKQWVEYEGADRQSGSYFTHDNKQPIKGDVVVFAWKAGKSGLVAVGDAVVKEKIIDSRGDCHYITKSVRVYPRSQEIEPGERFVKPMKSGEYGELIGRAWSG